MQLNLTKEFAQELKQKPIEVQATTIIDYLINIEDVTDNAVKEFLLEFEELLLEIKAVNKITPWSAQNWTELMVKNISDRQKNLKQ